MRGAEGMAAAGPAGSEEGILADLRTMGYEEVAARHGCSRGRVWLVARKHGARKNEGGIALRAAERERARREALAEVVGATQRMDALDYLGTLPDGCAALVATSIPYNIESRRYGPNGGEPRMPHLRFKGWLYQIVAEVARILKPGGATFLQSGTTRDDANGIVPLDEVLSGALREAGLRFQSRVAWVVPHGLTPRRRLAERYETALVFSKGEPATFNPTPARTPQKDPAKRAFKGPSKGDLSGCPLGAWPTNVWPIPNVGHNHPERTGHPAQFPLRLAKSAVMIWTQPHDLIIDPFCGAGTVHAACVEAGRRFSGADLHYGDLRRERMAKVAPDLVSMLPGVTADSNAVWRAEARRVDSGPPPRQMELMG